MAPHHLGPTVHVSGSRGHGDLHATSAQCLGRLECRIGPLCASDASL